MIWDQVECNSQRFELLEVEGGYWYEVNRYDRATGVLVGHVHCITRDRALVVWFGLTGRKLGLAASIGGAS